MLSNVSWSTYLIGVVILLVLYYLFIGAKYYREEINALLAGNLRKKANTAKDEKSKSRTESREDSASFDELETIVNDLRYAILEKVGRQADKSELLEQLQQRLASYSGLHKPAYRVALNNYIIVHAKEICGVVFSEWELNAAWDALPR